MLKIGRLRLSLPAGYEPRARRIASLVADELAGLSLGAGDVSLDRLALPSVEVSRGASDRQVAGKVAAAIAAGLHPNIAGNGSSGGGKP
jgi:hypothetical protein